MSKYIDADLYVEMQIYDDEHEEWTWWKGTIEDLLDQGTEEGCPPTIEVSEDCISRIPSIRTIATEEEYGLFGCRSRTVMKPTSVVPNRAEGEWQITDAYPHNVYCSECHKKFAQTHWAVWEDGSLPRNYCPNCGAKMKGQKNDPRNKDTKGICTSGISRRKNL